MSSHDRDTPDLSGRTDPPPPPPSADLRRLVVVLCIVAFVVSGIVGVLLGWPAETITRVWVGSAVVALYAAGLRPRGPGGPLGVLLAGSAAFGASELASELVRGIQ